MQKPCCDCAACQQSACRVVRVLSSAMRCAFAAVVATAALYEPLRWFSTLLFPWLDEELGGVGGVGGLTNMHGPHANCSTTSGGASAPYCFRPGLVLGFTPFALVLLSVWVLPLAVGAAAAARTTVIARPSQVEGGPRRAAAAVGAFLRQRSTGGVHLAGHPPIDTVHPRAVTAFLAINTLWFVLPLAQYALLDPFFRRSVWHVSLAVSLAAAYPLSWHLSLVALPSAGARFLPPLLGLSKEQLLSAHKLDAQMRKTCSPSRQSPRPGVRGPVKFTQLHSPRPSPRPRSFATGRLAARATVFWAALHAAGQVSYLLATGTLRARLSTSAGEAPSPPQPSPPSSTPPKCRCALCLRPALSASAAAAPGIPVLPTSVSPPSPSRICSTSLVRPPPCCSSPSPPSPPPAAAPSSSGASARFMVPPRASPSSAPRRTGGPSPSCSAPQWLWPRPAPPWTRSGLATRRTVQLKDHSSMASRSASQRRLTAPRCGRAPRGWPPPSPHLSRGLLAFGPCERASWAASAQTPTLLLPSLPWPSPPALSQRARLPRRSWAGGGLMGVEVASVRRARRCSSARTRRGCARLAPTPQQYPRERTSMWALEPLTPDTAVRAVLRDITERVRCVGGLWCPLPRAAGGGDTSRHCSLQV